MAGPTVVATIDARDNASNVLLAISKLAKMTATEMNKTGEMAVSSLSAADLAAQRHLERLNKLGEAWQTIKTGAMAYAAYRLPQLAEHAIESYRPVEKTMLAIQAARSLSDADLNKLWNQQTTLAAEYGMKPEDTAHAQETIAKRGFGADITEALTTKAGVLGLALGTSAENAAAILEGTIFGLGKHLSSAGEASTFGAHFSDIAAKQVKSAGMTPADIEAFWKFGAAASNVAGLTPETTAAIGMTLKRENIGGDESGVLVRQLSARLLEPTKAGRDALSAYGIDYDKYVRNGAKPNLSAAHMDLALESDFGKGLSASAKSRLDAAVRKGGITTNRQWAEAVVRAVQASDGALSKQDQHKVAAVAMRNFEASRGIVDGEKLLEDALKALPPQAALEFLGVKQGSKLASIITQKDQFFGYDDEVHHADGTAQRIADENRRGLNAALDRLTSSVTAAENAFVKANTSWLTPLADAGTHLAQFAANMSTAEKELTTLALTVGTAYAAFKTASGVMAAFGNLAKLGAGELGGSAQALNVSAGRLDVAAEAIITGAAKGGVVSAVEGAAAGTVGGAVAGAEAVGGGVLARLGALALPLWAKIASRGNVYAAAGVTAMETIDLFAHDNARFAGLPPDDKERERRLGMLNEQRDAMREDIVGRMQDGIDPTPIRTKLAEIDAQIATLKAASPYLDEIGHLKIGSLDHVATDMSKSIKIDDVKGTVNGEATIYLNVDASGVTKTETKLQLDGTIGRSNVVPSGTDEHWHRAH